MDRQATIGFVLIALLFVGWMIYTSMQTPPPSEAATATDTTVVASNRPPNSSAESKAKTQESAAPGAIPASTEPDSARFDAARLRFGQFFAGSARGEDNRLTIETSKYTAVFSTRGGGIKRWTLKNFSTWNNEPLQLIDWSIPSDLNLFFITREGKEIKTEDLYFQIPELANRKLVTVKDSARFSFSAVLPSANGGSIVKTFTIKGGQFAIDVDIETKGLSSVIANNEYQVTINSPALTELNTVDEATFAEASAFIDDERQSLDVSSMGDVKDLTKNGKTHWVSAHNKYFITALICRNDFSGNGAYIKGEHIPLPFEGAREIYQSSMKVRFRETENEKSTFSLYIGPMDYDLLKDQHPGLEQTISLGWAFIVRPFSEYLVIPLFSFLHTFIPNYGIVILLFTLIIKLLLYPLTKSSTDSMKKMQALQPMINDLREKYKDDQQRLSSETMKLYRDYGVNPAGGCLPMLLQMPILFALFTIFRSTIDLRHEPFVLWITDLSAPDILFHLPFKIPLLGTDFVSVLALLMSVTMFIQQKQTVKDPRQAAMVWMMPIMFFVMFNAFPSGLNLYYFTFNLLSILQQWQSTRKTGEFELKKVAQKKRQGWMERAMNSLEDKAKQQKKLKK